MRKKDLHYVSLDAKKFLTDEDFLLMSDEERGVYCSIIFYLYANGGSISAETKSLSRLCNCKSVKHFEKIWEKIQNKFLQKRAKIFHKKVSRELSRKAKLTQLRSEAGIKGNKIRWQSDNKAVANQSPEHRERKGKEANRNEKKEREIIPNREHKQILQTNSKNKDGLNSKTDSPEILSDSSSTRPDWGELQRRKLILHELLCRELKAVSAADMSTFRNFVNWLGDRVTAGKFDYEKIWHKVAAMADDSLKGRVRNPAAVFMSKVKSELGYLKDE